MLAYYMTYYMFIGDRDRNPVLRTTSLTLWGKQAEQYNETDHPVIAFKGAKVGDFQGQSIEVSWKVLY